MSKRVSALRLSSQECPRRDVVLLDRLGFTSGSRPVRRILFGIVHGGAAMIMIKAVGVDRDELPAVSTSIDSGKPYLMSRI